MRRRAWGRRSWAGALAFVLWVGAPAGARVAGGGPASSDCFVEFDGITAARGSSLYLDTQPGGTRVRWDFDMLPSAVPLGTSDGTPAGSVSEGVVAAVLWDLLDPTNEAGDTLAAREAVFGALGYLGGPRFTDRGAVGADLLDVLDGWFCLGHGARGDGTSGVEGNVVGLHRFPYDFAPLPSCR